MVDIVGRDSSVCIATRYRLDGPGIESRWGGARSSVPAQTGPGTQPASYTMRTRSFPGVKQPGRGVDCPPPSSVEVKERVGLYLHSPSGPSLPIQGRTLFYCWCGPNHSLHRLTYATEVLSACIWRWTLFFWAHSLFWRLKLIHIYHSYRYYWLTTGRDFDYSLSDCAGHIFDHGTQVSMVSNSNIQYTNK